MNLKALKNAILDFIYPKTCLACETQRLSEEDFICISCMIDLPKTNSHITPNETLERKFWGKISVKAIYSFLYYPKNSSIQNILYAIKYKNKPQLAEILGKWYSLELKNANIDKNIDFIVPVPMFKAKQKLRGYNQAEEFGKGLAEGLGLEMLIDNLLKTKSTVSQTKTKSRFGRFKNTEGVFEVLDSSKIQGKKVLLVDDVLTSGATLEEAGRALLEAGCGELYIATIAAAVN
jgi:ComF family protein